MRALPKLGQRTSLCEWRWAALANLFKTEFLTEGVLLENPRPLKNDATISVFDAEQLHESVALLPFDYYDSGLSYR